MVRLQNLLKLWLFETYVDFFKIGQTCVGFMELTQNKINDTLVYVVKNEVECFTTKMTFNYSIAAVGKMVCVFQSYIFDCETCAKNHLADR